MATPVWLYVPNLIGYFRVLCSFLGFYYATRSDLFADQLSFLIIYMVGFLLDAADGYYARLLNQCSKMGAVLDMVTDRFSTAGVCVLLAGRYKPWTVDFIGLIALDLSSHYAQMYSTLSRGIDSHKKVDSRIKLLHLYYTNRTVLGIVCLSAELFYLFAYLAAVPALNSLIAPVSVGSLGSFNWAQIGMAVASPLWALKQYLNVSQLVTALLSLDAPVSVPNSEPEAAAAGEATATAEIDDSEEAAASPVRTRAKKRTASTPRSRRTSRSRSRTRGADEDFSPSSRRR